MAIDPQREAGVRVPDLIHDAARIDPEGNENRCERVAQLVWCQTLGQRDLSRLDQHFVGHCHGLVEYAPTDVALDQLRPGLSGEHERAWASARGRTPASRPRGSRARWSATASPKQRPAGRFTRRARPAPVALGGPEEEESDRRPPWLEPYGGDPEWRSWMWGGIVALYRRYPAALEGLKDGWWKSETHVETLCALVVWRQWIDDAGRNPREELAFQVQLSDYGLALRQEGGGVTRAWKPGPAPDEWRY